jgi:hypothetical protein
MSTLQKGRYFHSQAKGQTKYWLRCSVPCVCFPEGFQSVHYNQTHIDISPESDKVTGRQDKSIIPQDKIWKAHKQPEC